ncbi:MAG: nucleotidyltransferase domain-containing protein [Thermoprotei archaeon]
MEKAKGKSKIIPKVKGDIVDIIYDNKRWNTLHEKRAHALKIIKMFKDNGIFAYVHGSVARGDVEPDSDIDIYLLHTIGEGIVLSLLETNGFSVIARKIIQATPFHVPKLQLIIDKYTSITIPLGTLHKTEHDFYKFGGEIGYEELQNNIRVPGVDKRLMLIQPTSKGHIEMPIMGQESFVARLLNIDIETVLERERVLLRRNQIGRTGLYIDYTLAPNESIEQALRHLISKKPSLKKRLSIE